MVNYPLQSVQQGIWAAQLPSYWHGNEFCCHKNLFSLPKVNSSWCGLWPQLLKRYIFIIYVYILLCWKATIIWSPRYGYYFKSNTAPALDTATILSQSCIISNLVAFGHNKLWQSFSANNLSVISQTLCPLTTTNCGILQPQTLDLE